MKAPVNVHPQSRFLGLIHCILLPLMNSKLSFQMLQKQQLSYKAVHLVRFTSNSAIIIMDAVRKKCRRNAVNETKDCLQWYVVLINRNLYCIEKQFHTSSIQY